MQTFSRRARAGRRSVRASPRNASRRRESERSTRLRSNRPGRTGSVGAARVPPGREPWRLPASGRGLGTALRVFSSCSRRWGDPERPPHRRVTFGQPVAFGPTCATTFGFFFGAGFFGGFNAAALTGAVSLADTCGPRGGVPVDVATFVKLEVTFCFVQV